MLLRTILVDRVVPEYSASGETVSYRLYSRSVMGWKYDYCLLHQTNQKLIQSLLRQFKVNRLEELQGAVISGFIEGNRLVRLAEFPDRTNKDKSEHM